MASPDLGYGGLLRGYTRLLRGYAMLLRGWAAGLYLWRGGLVLWRGSLVLWLNGHIDKWAAREMIFHFVADSTVVNKNVKI